MSATYEYDEDSSSSWGSEAGDKEDTGDVSVSSDESFLKDMESFMTSSPNQENVSCKEGTSKVIVQLPHDFSAGPVNLHKNNTGPDNLPTTGDEETQQKGEVSSEGPFFVPTAAIGKLRADGDDNDAKDSSDDDADDVKLPRDSNIQKDCSEYESSADASWSLMSSKHDTKQDSNDDASSIVSSLDNKSTISGFDLISLGGRTQKQCQKCSFLNSVDHNVCQGCFVALVANPNMTVDEQLALYLQKQEEEQAFEDTLAVQSQRKDMHSKEPLLFRAQTLARDVHNAIDACRKSYDSSMYTMQAIPEASLAILASRFIDCVEEEHRRYPKYAEIMPVKLNYCISEAEPCRLTKFRRDGFPPFSKFGETPEAAINAFMYLDGEHYLKRTSKVPPNKEDTFLSAIREVSEDDILLEHTFPEQDGKNLEQLEAPARLCWIVLIVMSYGHSDFGIQQSVPVTGPNNPTAYVYTRKKSCQSLPLVSFDANLIHDEDFLQYVTKRVKTACEDFFYGDGGWPTAAEVDTDEAVVMNESNDLANKRYDAAVDAMVDLAVKDVLLRTADDEAVARALQASFYKEEEEEEGEQSDLELKASAFAAMKESNDQAEKRNDAAGDAMVDFVRAGKEILKTNNRPKQDIIDGMIDEVQGLLPKTAIPEKE